MIDKCELCGGSAHPHPDIRRDQFGLTCPGTTAAQEDQDTYLQALAIAYLNLLTTEAENYANTIGERKKFWYERTRSDATQEELQADCDQRVAEVGERVPVEPTDLVIDVCDLIDPPHLTVKGELPRRHGLTQVHEKDRTESDDAALFVDTGSENPDHDGFGGAGGRPGTW